MSLVVGFVLGIVASAAAQYLAHRLTTQREQRADLMATLDRAIKGLIAGNHRIQQFIAKAGTGAPQQIVQEAADNVSAQQIEMRAALLSLRVRLRPGDAMVEAFNDAELHFVAAFAATRPALEEGVLGPGTMGPAFMAVHEYNEACERAIEVANSRFGERPARRLPWHRNGAGTAESA